MQPLPSRSQIDERTEPMNSNHSNTHPPYIVIMLDPIVHPDDRPYCGDETCPCMEELYDLVEQELDDEQPYTRADEQADLANAAYYDELGRQG